MGYQEKYSQDTSKEKRGEIRIRDPFVVPDENSKSYYLFGTTDPDPWHGKGRGFSVYQSRDLEGWKYLGYAFLPEKDFWGKMNFWAPEVHRYQGKYFMFASFKADNRCRGVGILVSREIAGPYRPLENGPVTPSDWECLDGTLYLDREGWPWLVFCHEWLQIQDGTVCCVRLSRDLKTTVGKPEVLFHASEAPWSVGETGNVVKKHGKNYVTDGPFLFQSKTGTLKMLWSSFSKTGYAIGVATSGNGLVTGPWQQSEKPFYQKDGGHGMLFQKFNGGLTLAIHTPNQTPYERAIFLPVAEDRETGLKIL